MTKTMKRWTLNGAGRDNLTLVEAAVPTPGPGEILVKATAASLNYRDKLLVDLGFGLPMPQTEPLTPLSDLSGTVAAVGPGVTRFAAGDAVISTFLPDWIDGSGPGTARDPNGRSLGGPIQGVLAEYAVLHQDWAVRAHADRSAVEHAALRRPYRMDRSGRARQAQGGADRGRHRNGRRVDLRHADCADARR